jgi:hypothetical protein
MPTVLRIKGYRIGFFSADGDEPPHVHVAKSGNIAKFWLGPVQLAKMRVSRGMNSAKHMIF